MTLLVFQNCTPAVPFGTTDHFQELANSAEFPYEVRVDQVAYMSCSEQEDVANDGTFFTFRVGAFRDGGIRVTDRYRNSIDKVDEDDVPWAMAQSPLLSGTRLQLALRTVKNFQLMYLDEDHGTDGLEGYDYFNFFPEMSDDNLISMLWYDQSNRFYRIYPQAQFIEDYRFHGELQFMKSQIMENGLRNFLKSDGILAVNFVREGEINPLGPGSVSDLTGGYSENNNLDADRDIRKNVWGVGMKVNFKQPSIISNPGGDMPPRVLASVQDIFFDQRLNGADARSWSCPNSMQFTIVMPNDVTFTAQDQGGNDVTITRCNTIPDPPPELASTELNLIRQSLYVEDWWVDMGNRCIVPKSSNVIPGSCYGKDGNSQQTHQVNYDSFASNGCGFTHPDGHCPHYASICIRN